MGAFLLLNERQKYVRWFMDLYTEEIAKNPKVKISFVGHSNGTYILASAMERYSSIEVHNVVFAGSVVQRDYSWNRWQGEGRVQAVQNYIAAEDWVVAIFPRLFELITEITPLERISDIGSAGFNGFEDTFGNHFEHIVKGGHSGALDVRNHDSIAGFIAHQIDKPSPDLLADNVSGVLSLASRLCWLIWVGLASLIFGLGLLFTTRLGEVTQLPVGIFAIVYVVLIWLLLETV
jgi:pimeloyl-ACP methyl ester carboxylesterase